MAVSFTVISPPDADSGETEPRRSTVVVPIKVGKRCGYEVWQVRWGMILLSGGGRYCC